MLARTKCVNCEFKDPVSAVWSKDMPLKKSRKMLV